MTGNALHNETLLLQQVAAGNQQAFADVYRYYLPRLYRYVYPFVYQSHEETEEILQDVFFKVWLKRETLPALSSFQHYLFRMAKNRVLDGLRKMERQQRYLQQATTITSATASDPEADYSYKIYKQAAEEALQQMSAKRRRIFELHTQYDLTMHEIARQLGMSRSAVKKQLHTATELIKAALKNHGDWVGVVILLFSRKL